MSDAFYPTHGDVLLLVNRRARPLPHVMRGLFCLLLELAGLLFDPFGYLLGRAAQRLGRAGTCVAARVLRPAGSGSRIGATLPLSCHGLSLLFTCCMLWADDVT
jgi:hypothetical protein